MVDLLIRGGEVVTPAGVLRTDVAVQGERIAAVGETDGAAARVIDAAGMLVLPGLVDAHVHLQCAAWNAVTPNDFYHGTVAAALGGVTTVIDFPTQRRGRPMMEAVAALQAQAEGRVVIDYGLHLSIAAAGPETLAEMPQVVAHGVASFKLFTTYRAHNLMLDEGEILDICRRARECSALPGVHAENDSIAERNYARFEAQGLRAPRYHALAKPDYVEAEAINRMLFLARVAEAPLYIYHLSTAAGVDLVRRARRQGQPVLAETCTHYLTLTRELLDGPDGVNWICSPPLRDPADQEALWSALNDGTIAVLSTDEAGFNAADKRRAAGGPLQDIPNGLPGVSLRLPVIFTCGVQAGRLSLERFVDLCCTNPARIFGLYPRKGVIAPGSDADLIVVDPHHRVTLNRETQHMPVDWCPYEGLPVSGFPRYTIARGGVIVDDYRFNGTAGRGQFLPGRFVPQQLAGLCAIS